MLRLPSRVVFPFGYRISVRQLSDTDMDRRDPNADGIWDDATKTIGMPAASMFTVSCTLHDVHEPQSARASMTT